MSYIAEPKLKGVLKFAPISNNSVSTTLTPENITSEDLLQPLQDIVDICGTNPTSINFSINGNSSEESGRTSDLNMHKDILGRVRSFDIQFPMMTKTQFQPLQEFFMELTEDISSTEEQEGEVTPDTVNENLAYVVWYLMEYKSPESTDPIREIVYVGDSAFTNIETFYRPSITYTEQNNQIVATKTINEIYVKNVKLPLIAKTAKARRRFTYNE